MADRNRLTHDRDGKGWENMWVPTERAVGVQTVYEVNP
jgi:hypothetical protein